MKNEKKEHPNDFSDVEGKQKGIETYLFQIAGVQKVVPPQAAGCLRLFGFGPSSWRTSGRTVRLDVEVHEKTEQ